MKTHTMVATCKKCRAWYNIDMEESIDNEHYDMRTGFLCENNNDKYWHIVDGPDREDWQYAN